MLFFSESNNISFNLNKCCQCGVCISACPQSCLKVSSVTSDGYIISCDNTSCLKCGFCISVCPAAGSELEHVPSPVDYAKAEGLWLAAAQDEEIRKMASSGGVTRSIMQYVLDSGTCDAVYSLKYPPDESADAMGVWLTSMPDQAKIPCSLYRPILWGKNLGNFDKIWAKVLLVGLPCQLKAGKKLLSKLNSHLKILCLTIYCRKQKNFGYTEYVKRISGRPAAANISVVYRGSGWPGLTGIRENNDFIGREFFYPASCWNLAGCRFCTDCLNADASDLTVKDPWGLVSHHTETLGKNLVMAWTQEGQELIKDTNNLEKYRIELQSVTKSEDFESIKEKEVARRFYRGEGVCLKSRIGYNMRDIYARLAEIQLNYFPHDSFLMVFFQKVKEQLRLLIKEK